MSEKVSKILNYEQNRERIYYLLKEQGLVKSSLELFMEDVHNTSLFLFEVKNGNRS